MDARTSYPRPLSHTQRVLVVGVWGVGKTTVGERLAGALGWRFKDSDALIPSFVQAVRSHDEIALSERVRRLRALIERPNDGSPCVIATNMRPLLDGNRRLHIETQLALESKRCIVVEVQRDLGEIASFLLRTPVERAKRPNLRGDTYDAIRTHLEEVRTELAPLYERYRSSLVNLSDQDLDQALDQIVADIAALGANRTHS